MDMPLPTKKVRSCSSSEETPVISHSSNEPTPATPLPPATILEAVHRYETEASRRNSEAQAEVACAKEDVLASMETLKRAHERLGRVEAVAEAAAQSWKIARDYVAKWEVQLNPSAEKVSSALEVGGENDDHNKHVSFAPLHHAGEGELTSTSVGSSGQRKVKRKRIRVTEHGWGVYEGYIDSLGEPHGRGTVSWENGGKYSGEWQDGKANGHGTMDYASGDRYEGHWKDGTRFGHGTHYFKDGGVYSGQWRNATPHGNGRMTLKNGSHYVGSWKDGKWDGPGIVRPVNGGEWEGSFELGKCTIGTLRRPNGELEIGRYDSVNPDDVKEGVWWSIDRQSVWSIVDGEKKEPIDGMQASEIAKTLGLTLPREVVQLDSSIPCQLKSP